MSFTSHDPFSRERRYLFALRRKGKKRDEGKPNKCRAACLERKRVKCPAIPSGTSSSKSRPSYFFCFSFFLFFLLYRKVPRLFCCERCTASETLRLEPASTESSRSFYAAVIYRYVLAPLVPEVRGKLLSRVVRSLVNATTKSTISVIDDTLIENRRVYFEIKSSKSFLTRYRR